ncbi:MAG: hypothetical protein ACJ8FP_03090, partial [Xanthobacteraceae bacterium]
IATGSQEPATAAANSYQPCSLGNSARHWKSALFFPVKDGTRWPRPRLRMGKIVMANGLTASDTVGIVGVNMYRDRRGSIAELMCLFVAVQTDWKWMQWYWFSEALRPGDETELVAGTRAKAVEDVAGGFGPKGHEFRRGFLHLSKPLRVDQLAAGSTLDARLFAFSAPRDSVWATIEAQFPRSIAYPNGTQLTIRQIHLHQAGATLPGDMNSKGVRGKLVTLGKPEPFARGKLIHPPNGFGPGDFLQLP